jgi:hypothetical protein
MLEAEEADMQLRHLSLAVGFSLAAGLAAAQLPRLVKAEVEHDPQADFTTFKTFQWKDTQVPADNASVHTSVTWYVERELEKKGLRKSADEKPDLLLRYYTLAKQTVKGVPSQSTSDGPGGPSTRSTNVDFRKELQGILVLEIQRAADEKVVWKATTPWGVVDKAQLDAEVDKAVHLLLAEYPPEPKKR